MMPNVGPAEIGIVLVIALLIFGPKRLPELGRSVGGGIREFRSSISSKRSADAGKEMPQPGTPTDSDRGREAVGGRVH